MDWEKEKTMQDLSARALGFGYQQGLTLSKLFDWKEDVFYFPHEIALRP